MTADLYDQDADHTPPHGIERSPRCPKGCPLVIDGNGEWDSPPPLCRYPFTCPLGAAA